MLQKKLLRQEGNLPPHVEGPLSKCTVVPNVSAYGDFTAKA